MKSFVRRVSGISLDKNKFVKREVWPHHFDFILSCVGYAVGFGSIWRFPYLCMRNGGGAFLIPYIIFMVLCGVPLFYMELAIGQFSAASPLSLWDMCPLFKGLGWAMIVVSGIVCVYYNIILTWVLYYLVVSFASDVPWRSCDNWWNTCRCMSIRDNASTLNQSAAENCSDFVNKTTPAEEFWKFNALEMSDDVGNLNGIRWQLCLCLIFAWILIFVCLFKGVKSLGKVVYFTATSPYFFLTILLIRNSMLDGSLKGVKFYLEPKWEKLADFSIWAEAALQVFYSLGPGWGGLITLSSFNKFKNNCYRDAMIIPVINCLTSIFGGFVIFTVIGHMAHLMDTDVEKVMEVGPGVTFVAYPEAIAQLPMSPIWSILFFLMLITIGLDSQFGMFETVTNSFVDEFADYLRAYKAQFTGLMCVLEFLIALPLVSRGGIYMFTLMDWYCGTFSLALIALLEVVVVFYIYGLRRFQADMKRMLGFTPGHYWTVMWCFVTPAILLLIFASSIFMYKSPTYGKYHFPNWALAIGWLMGFVSIIPIPLTMIYKVAREKGPLVDRVRKLLQPAESWGAVNDYDDPMDEIKLEERLMN